MENSNKVSDCFEVFGSRYKVWIRKRREPVDCTKLFYDQGILLESIDTRGFLETSSCLSSIVEAILPSSESRRR